MPAPVQLLQPAQMGKSLKTPTPKGLLKPRRMSLLTGGQSHVSMHHEQSGAKAGTHPAAINDDDSTTGVFTPSEATVQGFRKERTVTRVMLEHNRTLCCVKPDKVLRTVWFNPLNDANAIACPRLYFWSLFRPRHGRG